MSLARRSYLTILCDAGCGARFDVETEGGNVSGRVEAGKNGWRYIEGVWLLNREQRDGYHKNKDTEQTLRAIDVCPTCEAPEQGSRITKPVTP